MKNNITANFITDGEGLVYEFFLNLPFGETMAEQHAQTSDYSNRWRFTGHELDRETGLYYAWLSTDVLMEKYPSFSPYNYTLNNPINLVDPDGRIPYPITIRSFAPFKTFGGGFHGDNRVYSTGNVSARVHQKINFDTDKSRISAKTWSSPTSHRLLPGSRTETPSIKFTDKFKVKTNGDSKTFIFGTHSKGANPMVPGSPNIDVFSNFSITENKKSGILDVSGTLLGDNFPSTEAFITDPIGQNIFLGIGFYEGSPFSSLNGENKRSITEFNFSITIDDKGNFTGVKKGDKTYSIQEWNKTFENSDPYKNADK